MIPSLNLPQKGRTWVFIFIFISVKFFAQQFLVDKLVIKVLMFCPDPRNLEFVFNTTDLKWNYIVVLIVIIIISTTTTIIIVKVILKKNGSLGSPSLRV